MLWAAASVRGEIGAGVPAQGGDRPRTVLGIADGIASVTDAGRWGVGFAIAHAGVIVTAARHPVVTDATAETTARFLCAEIVEARLVTAGRRNGVGHEGVLGRASVLGIGQLHSNRVLAPLLGGAIGQQIGALRLPGDPGRGGLRTPGQVLNAPLEAV